MKKIVLLCVSLLCLLSHAELVQATSFKKSLSAWKGASYWGGKVSHEDGNLVLESTFARKRFWGRVRGTRLKPRYELPGRHYKITVTAKGKGEILPGFLVYSSKPKKKFYYDFCKPEKPFALTGKYAKYSYTVKLDNVVATGITPIIDLLGENSLVKIRSVRIERLENKELEMTDLSGMAVVPAGTAAAAKQFKFSKPDTVIKTMVFPAVKTEKAVIAEAQTNADGVITVPVNGKINALTKVVAAYDGCAVTSCVLGVAPDVFAELDELAKKVKADRKMSILYIGDSLNDFDRTYNAVDQLEFFLNKYNPGKFKIYNYSVAGDFITRVLDRFSGKRKWDVRYNGIFDRKYDLVLISLGNNDTRSLSSSDYKKPLVPVKNIKPDFEKVIAIIREQSNAPVWVLSASCSDTKLMEEKSNKRTAAGGVGVRFGIVEHAENFNKELKALAENGENIRYVDIYTPMKEAFSADNYADGVHLSLKGHTFFAKLLLKAFAEK